MCWCFLSLFNFCPYFFFTWIGMLVLLSSWYPFANAFASVFSVVVPTSTSSVIFWLLLPALFSAFVKFHSFVLSFSIFKDDVFSSPSTFLALKLCSKVFCLALLESDAILLALVQPLLLLLLVHHVFPDFFLDQYVLKSFLTPLGIHCLLAFNTPFYWVWCIS